MMQLISTSDWISIKDLLSIRHTQCDWLTDENGHVWGVQWTVGLGWEGRRNKHAFQQGKRYFKDIRQGELQSDSVMLLRL